MRLPASHRAIREAICRTFDDGAGLDVSHAGCPRPLATCALEALQ
jgi:hypothetical protein